MSSLNTAKARGRLGGFMRTHPHDHEGIAERRQDLALVNLGVHAERLMAEYPDVSREDLADFILSGDARD